MEMFCTTVVPVSGGPALTYFYMIHRGGRDGLVHVMLLYVLFPGVLVLYVV